MKRDCSPHPWGSPLRAARYGASLRLSKFVPDEFVEPKRVRPHLSLRQTRKTPRKGVLRSTAVSSWRRGIVRPIHGAHPFALRATGPAFGCPNSFRTNLSNPRGFVHTSLSARHAKRPARGCFAQLPCLHGDEGLFAPSMGLTPSRCALRGQPSAVQIRSGRICRTQEGSSTPLSPPDTQNAPQGGASLNCRVFMETRDCSPHPWGSPLRAARYGASLRLSKFVPDEFVEPKRVRPHLSLRQTRKTPREGAFCVSGGERGIRTLDKAFDPILP